MRLLSGLCGTILLLAAVVFAVANRQAVDVNLWPFALGLSLPLYLLALGILLTGALLGFCSALATLLPQHLRHRQLRQELAALHDKLDRLLAAAPEPAEAAPDAPPLPRRWRL